MRIRSSLAGCFTIVTVKDRYTAMRTRNRYLTLLILGLGTASRLPAQAPEAAISKDIRYLADDHREGRGVGTAGLDSAAAYIAAGFRAAGLRPGTDDGFLQ